MFFTQPAHGTSHQAHDAAAQSQGRDPPEQPSAQGSAPPSAPTVIDLSSPVKPLTSSMRHEQQPNTRRERSADERRLLPDYSTPADAVAAPNPLSWMPGINHVQGAMHKKPAASAGFRPINTINDTNPRVGLGKPKTYSKQHRPYEAPIGKARHAGQTAYLEKQASSSTTPARNQSSRTQLAQSSGGASPGKRRKITHFVDLGSDDDSAGEEREVLSPSALPTPAGTSQKIPPSAASPLSQSTNGSTSAITVSKRLSQPESAFQSVDTLATARRKKARKPGSDRNQGARRISPFGGGNLSAQAAPIVVFDDDVADQVEAPRQHILQELAQGSQGATSHSTQEPAHSSCKQDDTISPHFPNLRINESTSERPAASRQAAGNSMELQKKFKSVPRKPMENDDSADELAMSDAIKTSRRLTQTPSKATQAANSAVKKKPRSNSLSRAARGDWPLLFARSHEYERHCPKEKTGHTILLLRVSKEPWRVLELNPLDGTYATKIHISHNNFNKVQTDDVRRIRLEGSRKQDGNRPIVDLEFENQSDHLEFRDGYAKDLPPNGRVFSFKEAGMQTLHSKALVLNDKVGTSEPVDDSIFGADDQHEQVQRAGRTPYLDLLKSEVGGSRTAVANTEKRNLVSKISTRPKRSTRSSVLNHDEETNVNDTTVTKYSVVTGLGAPWVRPLEYARGRQRAVVHFDDLLRLDEDEYLNDSLIDFYMIYLCDKLKVPSDKVYFFNTYFFTQLTKNTGRQSMNYKAVERWTSKIDVFNHDYIVVPINEATHWYLAIICNVSNITRKPVIEDFDRDLAEALEQSRREQLVTGDTEAEAPPRLLQPQESLDSTIADPSEPNDDDINLFEEDSRLNLVDPADMGNESQMEAANSQTTSMPLPQSTQTTQAPQDTTDTETIPEGILSKLTKSPDRKKTKRKHSLPKKDPTQPIIIILDSLSQTRSSTVRALKDWLAAEGKVKRGMEVIIKEKGYYPKASQIPMQNNWTDCGVYLLGYVEKFFQDPDLFKNKLLTGEMSATEDWPELKPVEMRDNVREIIFKLATDQKVARKAEWKLKNGGAKMKVSPAASQHEPTKPEPNESQSEQIAPKTPENHNVESGTESQMTQPKQHDLNTTTAEVPKPRLASPFSPKPQAAQKTSHDPDVESKGEVSGSQLRNPGFTTPGTKQAKRRRSPEVRITVTPSRTGLTLNGVPRSTEAAHKGEHARQTQETSSSLSPGKKRRANEDEDDDVLKLPPAKRPFVQSSPVKQRIRGSNPSQPITIEDSQEDKLPATLTSTQQIGLPTQRRAPIRSSPARQVLHSHSSIEQIPVPTPKITGPAHGQQDDFPGRDLETQLENAGAERSKPRSLRAGSLPSAPIYLERSKETYTRMEIDIHDGNKTRRQRVSQDFEIPETLEPESRSAA